MKNGVLYEGDTLDTVWPTPKKLAAQYWWNMGPVPEFGVKGGPVPAK